MKGALDVQLGGKRIFPSVRTVGKTGEKTLRAVYRQVMGIWAA